MKFLIASAIALTMALTTYFVNRYGHSTDALTPAAYQVSEAKRSFVEPETKARPPRFEAMKWSPSAEMRAPASKGK